MPNFRIFVAMSLVHIGMTPKEHNPSLEKPWYQIDTLMISFSTHTCVSPLAVTATWDFFRLEKPKPHG